MSRATRRTPVEFAREVLGLRLWSRQEEILRASFDHPRVAVRSGHKIGKSTSAAALALWFASDCVARPGARVVMTSSSSRQVRTILWRELRRLYRPVQERLGGELHKVPDAGLVWDDGREILGFSTDEPEKMAGLSGAHVLFIIDEASGVGEGIFEAIEGNRAGGARIVLFSNPTRTSGTFYEAFHSKRNFWCGLKVSSEEAARVTPPIPGLATRAWVAEKLEEWGRESPIFQVRCSGDFPQQGERAVIALSVIEDARTRFDSHDRSSASTLEVGVDVARFGDDQTVVALRRGVRALSLDTVANGDGPDTAGRVLERVLRERKLDEAVRIKLDVIGVGASVHDALVRTAPSGVEVIAVNVAERATDDEHFARLRDQLWFALRDWLRDGELPEDSKLEAELLAPEYTFDARGRYVVESKDETKKKLKRSPDRADALALAVFQPPRAEYAFTRIPSRR